MSREIPLTMGQVAIVDDEDFDWLNQWKWQAKWDRRAQTYYATRNSSLDGRRQTVRMHRVILSAPKGLLGDHANHDGLDNRRSNLRLATHQENCRNRRRRRDSLSGFKGVTRNKGGWSAYMRIDGGEVFLGYFADPADAARAYDRAATDRYGEFAHLNFPSGS